MDGFLSSILKMSPSMNIFGGFKFLVRRKATSSQQAYNSVEGNAEGLNCRVQLTKQPDKGAVVDAFIVQICGSIRAPSDTHRAVVRVLIRDVTDGMAAVSSVHSRVEQWQMRDSPAFCYEADLGKISNTPIILSDWMTVARVRLDWLKLPRKGKRDLRFSTSILSGQNSEELARGAYTIAYENSEFGYIDLQENIEQARTLAVALAFAVSAADNKLYNCEVELIKNWARANIDFSKLSNRAERKLEKALNKTVGFFRDGNQIDVCKICNEIAEMVPVAVRYDILDLCLRVAQANGVVTTEELGLLKNLANWLEVDMNRFREMVGKILPVSMHEVEDLEFVLGVNSDLSKNKTLRRLNKEYRKWNARVTNSDPQIRKQADNMLEFIAKARSECVA